MKLLMESAQEMMNRNSGDLDLNGTGITALPDNLTVGGWLDLNGTGITANEQKKVRYLQDGDYVPGRYLYADGILTHVKCKREIDGYALYVGKIKGKNVISDGTHYAHCTTLRDGISDLLFKASKDRGADQYMGLTLDSDIAIDDAITMYRIITGACKQGTQRFVDSLGNHIKNSYTVGEVIKLTRGQYGAERFAQFFKG